LKPLGLPKIEFLLKDQVPTLWPTYVGEKENNFIQSIWDKNVMLSATPLGTHWELSKIFVNSDENSLAGHHFGLRLITETYYNRGAYHQVFMKGLLQLCELCCFRALLIRAKSV
jgi:hypothetical protein